MNIKALPLLFLFHRFESVCTCVCLVIDQFLQFEFILSYSLHVFIQMQECEGNPFVKTAHCNACALLFVMFALRMLQEVFIELASTSGFRMPCDFSSRHKKAGSCQEHLDLSIHGFPKQHQVFRQGQRFTYYCTSHVHKNNLSG